jgi:hypothetical protein
MHDVSESSNLIVRVLELLNETLLLLRFMQVLKLRVSQNDAQWIIFVAIYIESFGFVGRLGHIDMFSSFAEIQMISRVKIKSGHS